MQTPLHLLEVNIKDYTRTDFHFASRHIIGDTPIEEKPIKIYEVKNSALIIRYLQDTNQPFALYGIYEQYWRKENHVFQVANPDLYFDDAKTINEIKNSEYYKKLRKTKINQTWNFGYWGITD